MKTARPIPHLHPRDWQSVKRRLREEYADLTEADLAYTHGRLDETLRRVEKMTGAGRPDLERIIQETCGRPTSELHIS